MKLHSDWKAILRYAWSLRLMAIAGLLSGLEFILPYISDVPFIPSWLFNLGSVAVIACAFWARLVAQQNLTPAPKQYEDEAWDD